MGQIRIFISYADEDKIIAHKLQIILEKAYGFKAFAFKRSLLLSQQTAGTIIENLEKCDFFIPIISQSYEKSAYSNQEAGIAFYLGKKIMPPIIDSTNSPCGFMSIYWGGGFEITQPKYIPENIAALVFLNIFEDEGLKKYRSKARESIVKALSLSDDFCYSTPAMRGIMKVEGMNSGLITKIKEATKNNRNINEEKFTFPDFKEYFKNKHGIDITS